MKRRKLYYMLFIVSIIILGVSLIMHEKLISYVIEDSQAGMEDISVLHSSEITEEGIYNFNEVEELDWLNILKAKSTEEERPVVGLISVPDVDLLLSIYNGVSNESLALGAGTMKPNQKMGERNYALAGHNSGYGNSLFHPLHDVEKGMSAYLTDKENIYIYEIKSIDMVDPERIEVIEDDSDNLLTLVTCNVDGSRRLIVRGTLISRSPVERVNYSEHIFK